MRRNNLGFKICFILFVHPDQRQGSWVLGYFVNGLELSFDSIASMSITETAEKIQKVGMQNKNVYYT